LSDRQLPGAADRSPSAYQTEADLYDARTEQFHAYRDKVVDVLALKPGDSVVDVGCGTGLCFPSIEDRIGPDGAIIGIDESSEMLECAAKRVANAGWTNVTLIEAPAEKAQLPIRADAAVFCAVHDILQSPAALENIFGQLRPGAWIAATGGKWATPWAVGVNLMVYAWHEPYVRNFAGFDQPWRHIEELVDQIWVVDLALGGGYLALGKTRELAADAGD
jgi:demethylmenaquinone methyltransferase/2-methoxy-6-polyprenyl-1,4-benzoquinol methylase